MIRNSQTGWAVLVTALGILCLGSGQICLAPPENQTRAITLNFGATVGEEPAACDQAYTGLGTTGESAEILDLRFYVSNIRLINTGGEEVPLSLEQDGKWQFENVALLDFENGTGNCADTGTTDVNAEVRGMVPEGEYSGVVFDVAVPFDLNHDDLAASPSPLNVSAMFWTWAVGHKFVRVDLQTGGGLRWNMHLGSTMCESDGPADPPVSACARPNVPTIDLASFDPDEDTIVFDLLELFASSDLSQDTADTASGCQTFPDDVNECTDLFPNLGLDFTTGTCVNGCAGQTVFRVEHEAHEVEGAEEAIQRGQAAFTTVRETSTGSMVACAQCHGPEGSGLIGPDLRPSVAAHIQQHTQGDGPHPVKFTALTQSEIHDIAAFLASNCQADPECEPESVDEHDHGD